MSKLYHYVEEVTHTLEPVYTSDGTNIPDAALYGCKYIIACRKLTPSGIPWLFGTRFKDVYYWDEDINLAERYTDITQALTTVEKFVTITDGAVYIMNYTKGSKALVEIKR